VSIREIRGQPFTSQSCVPFLPYSFLTFVPFLPSELIPKPPVRCHHCGGVMQLVAVTDGKGRLLYNHPLPYLDSG